MLVSSIYVGDFMKIRTVNQSTHIFKKNVVIDVKEQ